MFQSRNPFRASNTAHRQTPSTGRDPTTSGMHLNKLTKTSSAQSGLRHGNSAGQTLKPGQTGNTEERARTWSISLPPTGERPFTSASPPTGNSWPESTLTATRSYSAPILATDAQTYGHEQTRSSNSSERGLKASPSGWMNDSTERKTSEGAFAYDWDSIYPVFQPGNAYWDEP